MYLSPALIELTTVRRIGGIAGIGIAVAMSTVSCTNDVSGTAEAPGGPQVHYQAQDLETGVTEILERDYQAKDVEDIECPNTAVIVGGFIRCTATISGTAVRIDLTVDNPAGQYTVGPPTPN